MTPAEMWEAAALYLIHAELMNSLRFAKETQILADLIEQHDGVARCTCRAAVRYRELDETFTLNERRKVNRIIDARELK